ncbi:MAG: hypothetical protein AAGA83_19235 [Cyanobacteria bacterium P01_F01_bin.116]
MNWFKQLVLGVISGVTLTFSPVALALQVLDLPLSQLQSNNLPTLSVPRGHSITLSFIDSGHHIQSVWLDDPSHLVFNTDTPLCAQPNQRDCGSASVIRIRQLAQGIDFPVNAGNQFPNGNRPGSGHSTLMTLVATDSQNQPVLYSVVLNVVPQSTATYATIRVVPDRPYSPPGIVRRQVQTRLAEIRRGLQQAQQQQLMDTQHPQWAKLQSFLSLASTGNLSLNDAIAQSGVSRALIDRLAAMGNPSPPLPLSPTPHQPRR